MLDKITRFHSKSVTKKKQTFIFCWMTLSGGKFAQCSGVC